MTFRRGDVCYADLTGNVGCEQGGIRPVVIIQNDLGNLKSPTTVVAPLTSQIKKPGQSTHVMIGQGTLPRQSMVMLEQIRTIDKRRILSRIGHLDRTDMVRIDKSLKVSLGL